MTQDPQTDNRAKFFRLHFEKETVVPPTKKKRLIGKQVPVMYMTCKVQQRIPDTSLSVSTDEGMKWKWVDISTGVAKQSQHDTNDLVYARTLAAIRATKDLGRDLRKSLFKTIRLSPQAFQDYRSKYSHSS